MSSLVSIIMPAYNAEQYISDAIDSVLAQTYKNWELIIIDDGSTDSTSIICKEYQSFDTRIKYYYQNNGRQGKARNLGIMKSNGDILAFLDADDLWLPEKLEVSIAIFENNEQDLLFTDAYVFNENRDLSNIANLYTIGNTNATYTGTKGLSTLLYQNRIPMLTVIVKKEAVLAVGCFTNRGVAEDYELWLNLLAAGYVLKGTKDCLSLYRVHENATTSSDKLAVEEVAQMLSNFFKNKPGLLTEYKLQIKCWLKRYLKLHAISNTNELRLPSVFSGFQHYLHLYKFILILKTILPNRLFNPLLNRLL